MDDREQARLMEALRFAAHYALRGLFFLVLRKKSKRIVNESQTVKERM